MKKLHIWVFYISLLGFGFPLLAKEYVKDLKYQNIALKDSLSNSENAPLGLRFGLDLYRIGLTQFSDDYNGLELVSDFKIGKELYLALELGLEETTKQLDQVNFTTNGTYYKLGFDYNMYKNLVGLNNQVHLGLRFATSSHSHILNNYTLLERTPYWPNSASAITNGFATGERPNLNAQWIEFVAGFKVQLLKNIYLGLSLRLNRLISDTVPDNFDNLYIPGFNQKTDENKFGAGFNFTLTYNLPFSFKKK
jgi:hypothetical protein|tara:strand:+ start:4088 stop:4840 length:753 start_codon:yes stop_codon:yes gene_type:complete